MTDEEPIKSIFTEDIMQNLMKDAIAKPFSVIDPFNPQNTVDGFVLTGGDSYGNLHITHVNGRECNQYVYATPKFQYPSDVNSYRSIKTSMILEDVNIYDKLDGTNILAFHYLDADRKEFVSFKVRLQPFVKESKFGNFLSMWKECLKRKPYIMRIIVDNPSVNLAFEMYGFLNKILIEYKIDLDTQLIYGITRKDGFVIDPILLTNTERLVNPLECRETMNYDDYMKLMTKLEEKYQKDKSIEGVMLYSNKGVYKCKPVSVIEEQGKANRHISYNDAYTTAMNALENCNNLEELLENTKTLLLEEWDEHEIIFSQTRIEISVKKVIYDVNMQQTVSECYKKSQFYLDATNKIRSLEAFAQNKQLIMPWIVKQPELVQYKPTQIYQKLVKTMIIIQQMG